MNMLALKMLVVDVLEKTGIGYGANGYDYEVEANALAEALYPEFRKAYQSDIDPVYYYDA